MMKRLKWTTALFLCLTMTLSQGVMNFAQTEDDGPQDYPVSDASFDVSNDRAYINWSADDNRISYVAQFYSSSDLRSKYKIGTAVTAGYTAEKADITDKVLKRGAGICHAQATAKKKARRQGRAVSAMGAETITAEGIMMIKQNRGSTDETKTFAAASTVANQNAAAQNATVRTQAANTQNTDAQSTAVAADYWMSLENGGWSCVLNDGQKATGWFRVGDKWHYAGSGGAMWADAWTKSAAEEGVYYYVNYNGKMLVSAQTSDGYLADYTGE